MKDKIVTFTITLVMIASSFMAVGQENKKVARAREEVAEAKEELKEAMLDSAADFQSFKREAEIKIKENKIKITELRAKKSNEAKDVRIKYDNRVLALERKNNELKKRIKGGKAIKPSLWSKFKENYLRDLDALGQDINTFTLNR